MGDNLKKVQPGQKFQMPAEAFNAFIDAAREVRARRHDQGRDAFPEFRQSGIIRVKNESGADRLRFDVLGIDEPVITPAANLDQFKNQVALRGVTPDEAEHYGRFVVLLEPLADGAIGRAFVSGVCPVRLNASDDGHQFADIDHEQCGHLKSCPFGAAQILWRDTDSSWAVVRLGNPLPRPYALDDCKDEWPTIYVNNDLADDVGRVVKVADRCYRVRIPICDEIQCVAPLCAIITARYSDCSQCDSCWKLTRCDDPGYTQITNTDLAEHDGKVIKLSDGYCYTVSQADNCLSAEPVSFSEVYYDCEACGQCYSLQACHDASDTLRVTNDLAAIAGKTSEELVDEGTVFEIGGKCYFVTSYGGDCSGAEHVTVENFYTECEQCGCFELTECDADPPEVIKAHSAVDGDSDTVNLRDYVGQVVRLAGGKTYTVAHTAECDGATSVTVLEAYNTCEEAKCYELTECGTETTIITYADLAEHAVGAVLKSGEQCYTLVGEHAWDEDAVGFTVDEESPDCDTCLRNKKYRLVPACEHSGCGGGGGGSPPEIVTTEDLHAAVGQYVKVDGHCYEVQGDAEGDVSDETLSYQGPYADCEGCQSAPVTTRKPRVTRIYIEGDQIKADVEEDVIENGLIVGFCGGGSQTIGKYCCDENPSSGNSSTGSGSW